MTPQQLIQNAKNKKAAVCLDYPNYIGVCFNNQYVYHWFEIINDAVYFTHSYSQNTGKTFKGVKHGIRIKSSLGFYLNSF